MKGFRNHILVPLAFPVAGTLIIAIVVFNYSRILLFLEKRHSSAVSAVVAIAIAIAIVAGTAYFASTRRRPATGLPVLGGGAMLLLFAGGYGAGASHGVQTGGGGQVASGAGGAVTVGAKEFAFTPRDDGRSLHTFLIENEPKFKKLEAPPGTTATGAVKLGPGTYTFYCSELGHRGSGMEGKLTVTKGK